MSKYNVIQKIMETNKLSENDKVYYVEIFLKGWHTEEELKWIWSE